MEGLLTDERIAAIEGSVLSWLDSHVLQWHALWQIGAAALCVLLALLADRAFRQPLLGLLERLPFISLLRTGDKMVDRYFWRLSLVLFLWIAVYIASEVTWPSQSYLLRLATNLYTAWVALSITSRMFRNPLVSRLVALALFIVVALNILGLRDDVAATLAGLEISFGESSISLLSVVEALFLLAVLLWGISMATRLLDARLRSSVNLTPSLQVLISKVARIVLLTVAFLIVIDSLGVDLTALAVLSGGLGVGIGFGLQKVVSNFLSGLILLVDKSIKPGDVIEIEGTFGWITALRGRYVSIVTRNGTEYLIPNEDLITQRVINWSHSSQTVRQELEFGVAYDSDPYLVRQLAREAAASVERTLSDPKPVCHITGFGDSSINFVLRYWIEDPKRGLANVRGDIFLALWDALQDNNITIPFPQRDVNFYPGGERPKEDESPEEDARREPERDRKRDKKDGNGGGDKDGTGGGDGD